MGRHRVEKVRPRYGRLAAAAASTLVTMVSVAGGVGLVPVGPDPAEARNRPASASGGVIAQGQLPTQPDTRAPAEPAPDPTALPAASGTGRRVVFSESRQRVWLVAADGAVRRTYLVSGSLYDNLDPGTYSVFSRSEWATGIDDSGTMRWFVRFAEGPNAAIGFHSIPKRNGKPLQTVAELGTPTSHGCIRQRDADAKALWTFAPVGTKVVVTA